MRSYLLPLTCPRCGCELDHVTRSQPSTGTESCAVAKCSACSREFGVFVQLRLLRAVTEEVREDKRRARRRAALEATR